MSEYNYKLAKKTIQMYSDLLESAELGMAEDWYWTAETIYEDKSFTLDLDSEPLIGGISWSSWATPTLLLTFKDGTENFIDCYNGCVEPDKKPVAFSLGVLSSPCQEDVDIRIGKFIGGKL